MTSVTLRNISDSQDPTYITNSDATMCVDVMWNSDSPYLDITRVLNGEHTFRRVRLAQADIDGGTYRPRLIDYDCIAFSTDSKIIGVGLENGLFTSSVGIWEDVNDEWVYRATIIRPPLVSDSGFGSSLSLNSDGTVLIVSDDRYDNRHGKAFQFIRSGNDWIWDSIIISPSDPEQYNEFGETVRISPDGLHLFASCPDRSLAGTAYVGAFYHFTNSGGTWTENAIIVPDVPIQDLALTAFAITPDASRLVAMSNTTTLATTNAYVFDNNGGSWSQSNIIISAINNNNGGYNYQRISISDAGETVLLASLYVEYAVFVESDGFTTQQSWAAYEAENDRWYTGWVRPSGIEMLTITNLNAYVDYMIEPITLVAPTPHWEEITTLETYEGDACWYVTADVDSITNSLNNINSYGIMSLLQNEQYPTPGSDTLYTYNSLLHDAVLTPTMTRVSTDKFYIRGGGWYTSLENTLVDRSKDVKP